MANIDQYEKLRLIGNGAFASIWKVRHRELGYIRAIKESKELVTDEHDKAYQTFLKECAVLLRLGNGGHPNIVRIYEPRLIDNRATVEMDFIQGETLNDYLARVRFMPIDEVMRFVREIVGALAYCHVDIYKYLMSPETDELEPDPADATRYLITPFKERELVKKYGVTHNDLHSNNIMRRDVDGSFVLLDFGLSVQDGQAVKSSARNDGALEYLAPEKWEPGKFPQGIGPWTDVYSLGILLYEVLAGRVPFPLDPQAMAGEQARHELYTHHMQDTPPPIEPLRKAAFEATHPDEAWTKDYPRWLENIILRCLAKDPNDRYANAREVLDDINAHAERSHDLPTALLDDKIDDLRHEKRQLEQQLDEARADVQHYSERLATLNDERERLAVALDNERRTTPSTALRATVRTMTTATTLMLVATTLVAVITWLCHTFAGARFNAPVLGCWVIVAWTAATITMTTLARQRQEQILAGQRKVNWPLLTLTTALVLAGIAALFIDPKPTGIFSLLDSEPLAYATLGIIAMLATAALLLCFMNYRRFNGHRDIAI